MKRLSTQIFMLYFTVVLFAPLQSNHQPITIYCHGVGADKDQISDYKDQIAQPCISFNFPDTQTPKKRRNKFIAARCEKIGRKYINREEMYMGQGKDILALKEQIQADSSYILFGLCRGGMAIINYMAQYNSDNILALVLDETPADVCDIIKKMQNVCIPLKLFKTKTIMQQCFPACPKNGKPPVENIPSIQHKDLPIFLIYAKKNTTFHFPSSTWKNYIAFKQAGFTNVYLCQLNESCQKAQGLDKIIYMQALNSFYKHHNLPYNADFATFTPEQLADLQPSIATVQQKLDALQIVQKKKKIKSQRKKQNNQCS